MENNKYSIVKLEEVVEVIDSLHKTPTYCEKGIPMIRVTDVKQGFLKLYDTKLVSEDVYEEFTKKRKPKRGDVILSRVGTYGISSYIDKSTKLCLGQNTVLLSPKINGKYFYYFLQSSICKKQIESFVTGTTQKTISLKNIKDIKIPIFDSIYEEKVSNILYNLDKKIELNNEMNKTLEEMAQTIFKSWFVDFEPFKDGEFEESELGMIPNGWKVVELSDIGTIVTGKTPSKNNPEHFGDEFKFITPKDIKGDLFMVDTERGLSFEGYKKMERIKFDKYSIGVSCIGSDLGEVYLNDNKGVSNQQINTLILDDINLYPYMYIKLNSMKNDFKNIASGSAVPIINKTTFSKIKIIVPPKNVYDEYFKNVNIMFERILSNLKQNRDLGETRDTLLPKLISGEIRLDI